MKKIYYLEFSHRVILQEMEIGEEKEKEITMVLGCHVNKIKKKFLTDDYSYYNGHICIFRETKAELLIAFEKYKKKILENFEEIEKELTE